MPTIAQSELMGSVIGASVYSIAPLGATFVRARAGQRESLFILTELYISTFRP